MKRSTPNKLSSPDAFAVLMGSSKKKKSQSPLPKAASNTTTVSSRFVLCPAGCGKHIPEKDINSHLDFCISVQHGFASKSPGNFHASISIDEELGAASASQQPETYISAMPPKAAKGAPLPSAPATNNDEGSNAFDHMMMQSTKKFSTAGPTKLAQRFHLNSDGSWSLTCYSTFPGLSRPDDIQWSTAVQLKAKKASHVTDVGTEDPPALVELSISAAIPSTVKPTRLVRRHSRLSISVLKSILQKSIRRRKPLPAVRVAMELADKSMGDLLRRLPIIILEDSFLHPSFPFLVWLMVAYSKDFQLNQFLLTKLFCIIYEMACCPWQDHVVSDAEGRGDEPVEDGCDLSIESYHQPGLDRLLEDHETMLWSMLVRATYGGMACDIRMLHLYTKAWRKRGEGNTSMPEIINARLSISIPDSSTVWWTCLPSLVHKSGKRQSASRVMPMVQQGLLCLNFADITTEGVDFHCSSILECVMSDRELVEQCYSRLAVVSTAIGTGSIPNPSNDRRAWLEHVLRRCMWDYSAGINRRLPLTHTNTGIRAKEDKLEEVWNKLVRSKAKQFADNYVRERLA